jgi:Flp pilus assembly protein TadG
MLMISRERHANDAGAIALVVAICSVVFLLVAALVVDLGMAMESRRDAQKAVDLAALAGGQELPDTTAATAVAADNHSPIPARRGPTPPTTSSTTDGARTAMEMR